MIYEDELLVQGVVRESIMSESWVGYKWMGLIGWSVAAGGVDSFEIFPFCDSKGFVLLIPWEFVCFTARNVERGRVVSFVFIKSCLLSFLSREVDCCLALLDHEAFQVLYFVCLDGSRCFLWSSRRR